MSQDRGIEIVRLDAADVALFAQIDRAERIDGRYRRVEGGLLLSAHDEILAGWPPGLLDRYLPAWRAAAAAGCPLFGAVAAGRTVGLALLDPRRRGRTAQLMSLYVDRRARRRGAARRLCETAFAAARAAGADAIYVSSSPTRGSVGFYWSMGFRPAPAAALDPELHALEPDDIHMIRGLEAE